MCNIERRGYLVRVTPILCQHLIPPLGVFSVWISFEGKSGGEGRGGEQLYQIERGKRESSRIILGHNYINYEVPFTLLFGRELKGNKTSTTKVV